MQHGLAFPFGSPPPSRLSGLTVLQVLPALEAGPSERTALDLAGALADAGARALVASTGGALVGELQARGGFWVPFPADSRNPLAMANNVRKLRDLIRAERVAVIHAHGQAAAWVALGAAQLTGTPLVTSLGERAVTARQAVTHHYDSVLARGDVVLVPSEHAGAAAVAAFPFVRDHLRTVPAGVDVHRFCPAAVEPGRVEAVRAAWGVEPDRRVVLVTAAATGAGQAAAVEAAALLRAEGGCDATFVFLRDPAPRGAAGEAERLIARHALTGTVRRVDAPDDRPAALLAASLVVLPCLGGEACGLHALEAQAMGVPVVVPEGGSASDCVPAPPRVAPRHRTGWHVPPGDTEALAAAIRDALAMGASARDGLATRACAHVERGFSRDRMTDATLDAYEALIEGRVPRTRAAHG